MIGRFKAFLQEISAGPGDEVRAHTHDELQLAAVALLVETALMDDDFDQQERDLIIALAQSHFALSEEEAETLVVEAQTHLGQKHDLYGFTRTIKDSFAHAERLELMEMLWQVVYADGTLHHYEANLMRRIAGLIYIADRENGEARKRAMAKLGLAG